VRAPVNLLVLFYFSLKVRILCLNIFRRTYVPLLYLEKMASQNLLEILREAGYGSAWL
jgi:hypothetical protein